MGLLKSIQKPCSLKDFRGQTIGVDAYGWLHRGVVSCAVDLALGKPTTRYIDFFMHRVRMLIHFGVTPYLVFDGDRLPSKAGTEKDRAERRKESKRVGHELLRMGKTTQAYQELQKAVDITPQMARNVIEELKRSNVAYIVAPYEADSQMAYLEKKGIVDAILSEDSDLLVFGAKTLLTKLDQYGECVMIRQSDFTACRDVNFVGWTEAEFRQMAILSGCDYLDGIHKMGLKTAHRFVRKYKTIDRVIRGIQLEAKMRVPQGYLESFIQAETTFLYQWVFCPEARELVNLNTPTHEKQLEGLTYIGAHVEAAIARAVAVGDLNPMTKTPLESPPNPTPGRRPFFASRTQSMPLVQTSKAASGKGIDAFFKPNRVPLAELDPNIFHPTASQQQLLAQSSRTWTADAVPLQRMASQPQASTPTSSRQPLSTTSTAMNQSHRRPLSQPNKRQRLCKDAEVEEEGSPQKSRFFGGPVASSSAPVTKHATKNSSFELWSDDSVEEAMKSIPDVPASTVAASRKSKITVHKDHDVNGVGSLVVEPANAPPEPASSLPSNMLLADTRALRAHSSLGLKRFALDADSPSQGHPISKPQAEAACVGSVQPTPVKADSTNVVQNSPPARPRPDMSLFAHSTRPAAVKTPITRPMSPASRKPLQDSAIAILDTPTLKRRRPRAQLQGSEDMLVPDSDTDESKSNTSQSGRDNEQARIESPTRTISAAQTKTQIPSLGRADDSGYGTFVFTQGADADDVFDEDSGSEHEVHGDETESSRAAAKRLDLGRFVFAA